MREVNRGIDEKRKKKKDEEMAKWWAKEQAKLDRGRRQQDSEEEEEVEGEGGDGSGSSVQWGELGGGDEDSSLPWAGPFPWHAPG